jgi:DNA invertase Pin-like site-specific DNA recombinase
MKLGYARVSTEDQHLDLQRTRLKEGGCGKLFEEPELWVFQGINALIGFGARGLI